MSKTKKILGTDEAWETGLLGEDENHASPADAAYQNDVDSAINASLGLKMISIRLEEDLIEDFKQIAALNGIGYQPLMRQALKRFADNEKKRILVEAYNAMQKQEAEKCAIKCDGDDDRDRKLAA